MKSKKSTPFVEHVVDLLGPLGAMSARAMFGGWGIYCEGTMFALVADDVLYLRTDDGNRPDFEALGLAPFKPWPDRPMTMPYFPVPETLLDDPDALRAWAGKAREASLRVAAARSRPAERRRQRDPSG